MHYVTSTVIESYSCDDFSTYLFIYIRVVRRALNLLRASFSPIFQYFLTCMFICHAPWILRPWIRPPWTPAMEMTREATERLQKRQERLRKRQEGPAVPRFRQQRLRKLSLRQRSRSPLSESQQRRDDRLSRRRERERKRRLRKQQRNERYAWGGVGRETELGGLLRLWRPNQRKERLA